MLFKLSYGALLFGLLMNYAQAQDPTKVEPKHYRLDFENDRVQVVSVHYGPHEKSGLHEHPGGVVVVITGGHLRFTDESGKVQDVYAKPGEARWFAPFKHKVENVGDTPYNAVYVGVKGRNVISGAGAPVTDEDVRALVTALAASALGDADAGSGKR